MAVGGLLFSPVADGAELSFGRMKFTTRHTPAHTSGHVVYILDGTPFHCQNSLFSGDLIFIGGAGGNFMFLFLQQICDMEAIDVQIEMTDVLYVAI